MYRDTFDRQELGEAASEGELGVGRIVSERRRRC